jgi:general secretion pathway protein M
VSGLAQAWSARPDSERRALAALAMLALAVLVIAFAWLPMERSRQRLAAELPGIEASIALMQQQSAEVKRLRSLPASASPAAMPLAALLASGDLTRALPGAQATLADERRVRLVAADAAYGALLETIASAQRAGGLRVETARIEALPAPGRVRAELTLARP